MSVAHRTLMVAVTALAALGGAAPAEGAWPGRNGRIVYETIVPAGLQIRTADLSGRHRRVVARIEALPGVGFLPAVPSWSPDGRSITYWGGPVGVRTMRADGHGKRLVSRWMDWPSWMPGGRAVVGVDARTTPYGFARVATGTRRVRHIANPRGGSPSYPRVSPDGRWIVYDDSPWLYRIPAGRGRAHRLVRGRAHAWSPDGRRLAYANGADVFSIRPDGRGRRLLHRGPWNSTVVSIAWSPDGRRLVLVRQTPRDAHDRSDVATLPARGGRERIRFSSADWIGRIDWQPLR